MTQSDDDSTRARVLDLIAASGAVSTVCTGKRAMFVSLCFSVENKSGRSIGQCVCLGKDCLGRLFIISGYKAVHAENAVFRVQ